MAFSISDRVRVIDQSSEYRGHRGTVKAVSGELHDVQLEGQGCHGRAPLRTDQLLADETDMVVSYAQCAG